MNILFIVTSCIYTIDKPVFWSDKRSIFTPDQRLQQTKDTIKSIKKNLSLYNHEVTISLLEGGKKNVYDELNGLVDDYNYYGKTLEKYINHPSKGMGEVSMIRKYLSSIKKRYDIIIKISGRYWLDENFTIDQYTNFHTMVFHKYDNQLCVSTKLYSIPYRFFDFYKIVLFSSQYLSYTNKALEMFFYLLIPSFLCTYVKVLGVSGYDGSSGRVLSE